MSKKYVFLVVALISSCFSNSQIKFENRAAALGVDYIIGTATLLGGNGVTFYDFDNDGWDDITFTSVDGNNLKFFKNVNGVFTAVNLNIPVINYQTKQVNWVDFDNDGDKDLFVTSDLNGNRLFENTGGLNFQDITVAAGFPTANFFTNGASWGDYNNDGFLDVFISNLDPNINTQTPNFLYKNNGDGTFTDVSAAAGIDRQHHLSFCSVFFDYNNDGWQDIYLANDRFGNDNQLYKNNGDGTFTEVGAATGSNVSINAMTTTVGDFNNDGWQDIYITNIGESAFLKNNGDGTFIDIATSTGTLFNSTSWGAIFLDADNDTDLDLYVSGSLFNIMGLKSAAFYENKLETGSEVFVIPTNAGFENDQGYSYSNAVGDVNNDGLPDFVVTNNNNQKSFLWENQNTESNNWLKLTLEGTSSNRDGIGARIEISINGKSQFRYTHCGEGYLSQNSGSEFFGLGDATVVDFIKIKWLGGNEDTYTNVPANKAFHAVEGSNTLSNQQYKAPVASVVYPNPIDDRLFISSENQIDKIEIYNLLGKSMYKDNYPSEGLNIAHLTSGVYLLKIFENGKVSTVKIVKN